MSMNSVFLQKAYIKTVHGSNLPCASFKVTSTTRLYYTLKATKESNNKAALIGLILST